jgi:hypothetical protein
MIRAPRDWFLFSQDYMRCGFDYHASLLETFEKGKTLPLDYDAEQNSKRSGKVGCSAVELEI